MEPDELAEQAYVHREIAARRRAESTLYHLNLSYHFAPPMEPAAAVVWTTLMKAKLASLRRELAGELPDFLGPEEMQASLQTAVERWGAFKHPVLRKLEERGLDAYRIWAKNWFGSCYGFSLQLACLLQRTRGEARRTVLENITDELDDETTHDDLRIRFYQRLGLTHVPESAIEDPDWVLESTELLNLRTGLCNLADPRPALGCFYTIEANWPSECRRHLALNETRFEDRALEYWVTHAFADEHHAAAWLAAVMSSCSSGEQRAAVVEGALIHLRLRWRMYDAIGQRFEAAST